MSAGMANEVGRVLCAMLKAKKSGGIDSAILELLGQDHSLNRQYGNIVGKTRAMLDEAEELVGYAVMLNNHLQEYCPSVEIKPEFLLRRARQAYTENTRTTIDMQQTATNALRVLCYGYEATGFERLKSEIWMQAYNRKKGEPCILSECTLESYARELFFVCSDFLNAYDPNKIQTQTMIIFEMENAVRQHLKIRGVL